MDAGEIEDTQIFEQRLERKESDGDGHSTKQCDARETVPPVLDTHAPPKVRAGSMKGLGLLLWRFLTDNGEVIRFHRAAGRLVDDLCALPLHLRFHFVQMARVEKSGVEKSGVSFRIENLAVGGGAGFGEIGESQQPMNGMLDPKADPALTPRDAAG